MFEVLERMRSIQFVIWIICDEFRFILGNDFYYYYLDSSVFKWFEIEYTMNGERICTWCIMESWDFCFYLDRQVPSIVELKDKLRLFFIVEEYEEQKRTAKKLREKLYRNPTISIKF